MARTFEFLEWAKRTNFENSLSLEEVTAHVRKEREARRVMSDAVMFVLGAIGVITIASITMFQKK